MKTSVKKSRLAASCFSVTRFGLFDGVRMNIRDDAPATGKAMNSKKPCLVLLFEKLAASLLLVAVCLKLRIGVASQALFCCLQNL
jgi:hypothetical protein